VRRRIDGIDDGGPAHMAMCGRTAWGARAFVRRHSQCIFERAARLGVLRELQYSRPHRYVQGQIRQLAADHAKPHRSRCRSGREANVPSWRTSWIMEFAPRSGLHRTRCWSKPDSNSRSHLRRYRARDRLSALREPRSPAPNHAFPAGTESLLTRRWREMDSNCRSRRKEGVSTPATRFRTSSRTPPSQGGRHGAIAGRWIRARRGVLSYAADR
jgi:hypothetical protein